MASQVFGLKSQTGSPKQTDKRRVRQRLRYVLVDIHGSAGTPRS